MGSEEDEQSCRHLLASSLGASSLGARAPAQNVNVSGQTLSKNGSVKCCFSVRLRGQQLAKASGAAARERAPSLGPDGRASLVVLRKLRMRVRVHALLTLPPARQWRAPCEIVYDVECFATPERGHEPQLAGPEAVDEILVSVELPVPQHMTRHVMVRLPQWCTDGVSTDGGAEGDPAAEVSILDACSTAEVNVLFGTPPQQTFKAVYECTTGVSPSVSPRASAGDDSSTTDSFDSSTEDEQADGGGNDGAASTAHIIGADGNPGPERTLLNEALYEYARRVQIASA